MVKNGCEMDFELIPAIDLKGGKCVRLQEGDAARSTEYSDDPAATALFWQEQGATRLHLVDLDGAFSGEARHFEAVRAIFRALEIPVQFGGGVRTLDHIERLLDSGADRVILGTIAVEHPEIVEEAVRRHGEAIVAGVDARNGVVALRGWVDLSSLSALDVARRMKSLGVRRIIYTDVSRDGMLSGINVRDTAHLAREAGIGVIASGGAAGMDDIRALWQSRECGIEGVILGRALYEKRLDFREALQSLRRFHAG